MNSDVDFDAQQGDRLIREVGRWTEQLSPAQILDARYQSAFDAVQQALTETAAHMQRLRKGRR